jgi:hypothetical protein
MVPRFLHRGKAAGVEVNPGVSNHFWEGGGQRATRVTVADLRAARLKVTSNIPKRLDCRVICTMYVQHMYNYV